MTYNVPGGFDRPPAAREATGSSFGARLVAVTIAAAMIALIAVTLWPATDTRTTIATDMSTPVEGGPAMPRTNPNPPASPPGPPAQ